MIPYLLREWERLQWSQLVFLQIQEKLHYFWHIFLTGWRDVCFLVGMAKAKISGNKMRIKHQQMWWEYGQNVVTWG